METNEPSALYQASGFMWFSAETELKWVESVGSPEPAAMRESPAAPIGKGSVDFSGVESSMTTVRGAYPVSRVSSTQNPASAASAVMRRRPSSAPAAGV